MKTLLIFIFSIACLSCFAQGTVTVNVGTMTLVGSNSATGGSATNVSGGSFTNVTMYDSSAMFTFDVTQFGATGNGSTDDSAAVQKAANLAGAYGGTVYFPNPTNGLADYAIGTNVYFSGNVRVTGDWCLIHYSGGTNSSNNNPWNGTNAMWNFEQGSGGNFMELDHLQFYNYNNEMPFIFDNNAQPHIHDCKFGLQGGLVYADVILGGTNVATQFQGYPGVIDGNCVFSGAFIGCLLQVSANSITIRDSDFKIGQYGVSNICNGVNFSNGIAIAVFCNTITAPYQLADGDILDGDTVEMNVSSYGVYGQGMADTTISNIKFFDNGNNFLWDVYEGTNTYRNAVVHNMLSTYNGNSSTQGGLLDIGIKNTLLGPQFIGNYDDNPGSGLPTTYPTNQTNELQSAWILSQFMISTNADNQAPAVGYGNLVCSNYDLYWVTPTTTNKIAGP
jgi:hypothetical protein